MNQNKYKILLVDDDPELSELLTEYIVGQGFDVTPALDGEAGLELALSQHFDLILLDVMMPKLDGFEVLKRLRISRQTPVLMLTAKGDDFDRIFGLELGADDYLPKPFNHRELVARIKAITRRIEHIQALTSQQQPLSLNGVDLNPLNRQVSLMEREIKLTGTEFQILQLLMKQAGNIVTKEVLSEKVLGRKLAPFDRSIDMHVSNIRRKLLAVETVERLKTVRSAGYIFLPGSASEIC